MYAIVKDGHQQYRVQEGDVLDIDYREAAAGSMLNLDRVLVLGRDQGVQIGAPTVAGASVTAEVIGPIQGPKIYIRKFRRRKNYRRRTGHRQIHIKVRIAKIIGA